MKKPPKRASTLAEQVTQARAETGKWTPALRASHGLPALAAPAQPTPAPLTVVDGQKEGECTCPSGNGSLRWPCPVHPPLAQEIEDSGFPDLADFNAWWGSTTSRPTPQDVAMQYWAQEAWLAGKASVKASPQPQQGMIYQQEFLRWNRSQEKPMVEISKEYHVAQKAVEFYLAATPSPAVDAESGEIVAWCAKDGDEWIVYDANSDTGQHILHYQKDSHGVDIFPIRATKGASNG